MWGVRARANGLERLSSGSGEGKPRRFLTNVFNLVAPFGTVGTRTPIFRWKPYYISIEKPVEEYEFYLNPAPEGLLQPVRVFAESLAVGGELLPDTLLRSETTYTWRIRALVEQDSTVWAAPDPGKFFTGRRNILEFYGFPNPFNPNVGEIAKFNAEFVDSVVRAWLKIRTAHPPHTPLLEQEIRVDPARNTFEVPPRWDGRDVLNRQMGYGVYIAELTVQYQDGGMSRAYYPVVIGPR